MFQIVDVKPLSEYRVHLRYANGAAGEVDLSHLVGKGVFASWREPGVFEGVTVGEAGQLCWGKEIELCPDSLYLQMTGQEPRDVFPRIAEAESETHAGY